MPYKSLIAQKRAQHLAYIRNKDQIARRQRERREEISEYRKGRYKDLQVRVRELKDGQRCADCDTPYPYYVLDFDHVHGEKIGKVSDLVAASCSWDTIMEEIAKCDLVCANCHRERSHQRGCDPSQMC